MITIEKAFAVISFLCRPMLLSFLLVSPIVYSQTNDIVQVGLNIDGPTSGDQAGYATSMSADGTILAIGSPFNQGNDSVN